jgi:ATP-dependent Clp protease protease subunit
MNNLSPNMSQEKETSEKTHSEQLQDQGIYVFMGDVDTESIQPIVEWILAENHVVKKKKKELLLMVCSSGGELESAFALIDVIRSSTIPVKTVGLGQIGSAGLMIFLAGKSRILTPNTSILSHQYSWGSEGKHHELWAVTKEFNLVHERMLAHYRIATGLDDAVIKEKLLPPQDVYLSAEEAVQLRICDYVSDLSQR